MLLFTMDNFFIYFEPVYVNVLFIYDSINSTWLKKVVKFKVPLEYLYSLIASGTLLNHIIYKENTKCNMIKFKETLRL